MDNELINIHDSFSSVMVPLAVQERHLQSCVPIDLFTHIIVKIVLNVLNADYKCILFEYKFLFLILIIFKPAF